MPPYRTNVATLDVPDNWHDQSIIAFRLPKAPGGGDASFVITRDPDKGVSDFPAYFAKQADNCARSLPEYEEIRREFFESHDRNAAWLEFQWVNDRTRMQLRQVYFDCGFFVIICTLTASPADMDFHDSEWRRVMRSMVFDAPPPPAQFP